MPREKTLLKEKTILIVDDDFIIREALKTKLSKVYRIVEAEDYNSAIRAYKDNDISLAIVDIDLRDKRTGIDLLMVGKHFDKLPDPGRPCLRFFRGLNAI